MRFKTVWWKFYHHYLYISFFLRSVFWFWVLIAISRGWGGKNTTIFPYRCILSSQVLQNTSDIQSLRLRRVHKFPTLRISDDFKTNCFLLIVIPRIFNLTTTSRISYYTEPKPPLTGYHLLVFWYNKDKHYD
jgi:hypothetical protein